MQGDRSRILTLDDVKAAARGGIPADQPTSSYELLARAAAQQPSCRSRKSGQSGRLVTIEAQSGAAEVIRTAFAPLNF